MNKTFMPRSWADFPVMPTLDPRDIIQSAALADNGGTLRTATFFRASNYLAGGPWINPVISFSAIAGNVTVPNAYDYASIEEANNWNSLVQMNTLNTAGLPPNITNIVFLKAGAAFVNNLYIDWAAGKSSQLIYFTLRDNALTSGDFQNAGAGTIPVFQFPTTATYSGGAKNLQLTLLRPGRYEMVLWVLDNAANYSSFERFLAGMMGSQGLGWLPSDKNVFGDYLRKKFDQTGDKKEAVEYALLQNLGNKGDRLDLDDDLINLLYDAFSNPNPDDVDWQGLSDYILTKADCDAKLLQKAAVDKKMAEHGHAPGNTGCGGDVQKQYNDLAQACRVCQEKLKQKPQTHKTRRNIMGGEVPNTQRASGSGAFGHPQSRQRASSSAPHSTPTRATATQSASAAGSTPFQFVPLPSSPKPPARDKLRYTPVWRDSSSAINSPIDVVIGTSIGPPQPLYSLGPEAQALINFFNGKLIGWADLFLKIFKYFEDSPADPQMHTKKTFGVNAAEAEAEPVMEKLLVLLSFFSKYPDLPPVPPNSLILLPTNRSGMN